MKKLLLQLTAYFRRPKFFTVTTPAGDLEIRMINDDTIVMPLALGITKERHGYFKKRIEELWTDDRTTTDVAIIISKELVHPSELYMVVVMIEKYHRYINNPGARFIDMLRGSNRGDL